VKSSVLKKWQDLKRTHMNAFKKQICDGIPLDLPPKTERDPSVDHAPIRSNVLTDPEKKLALKNALRYFPGNLHAVLAREFWEELNTYGHIYMYRFKPRGKIHARPISAYPCKIKAAAAIALMIQNNLDPDVAQYPDELITYGGNGAVFQNWAQYLLTMQYLAQMTDEQTLVMSSGHPLGLFPSSGLAPRVVVTNGLMVPNYSSKENYERLNALGVSQFGQMTAGSYMYIGPQGIVHGTLITILNAGRRLAANPSTQFSLAGKLFVSSGLGGMSGAQAKAAVIAGAVGVIAEINPKAAAKRFSQGWVSEVYDTLDEVVCRMNQARAKKEAVSLAFVGNVVDLWERLASDETQVDLGSDQTSLHNPFGGGYVPANLSFEESNQMMIQNPGQFKSCIRESLCRQVIAINKLAKRGMYFFDYGNAFLLEASRAGADIMNGEKFRYPSYVEDLMGPLYFDYGFGPFRWVCTSGSPRDLAVTDTIAIDILSQLATEVDAEIRQQTKDNLHWIKTAAKNDLVVGSQARILYADAVGRVHLAMAFNQAIASGKISAPIVIGRDHHDVSATDSPFRETANIYDGSRFTADMSIHNVIGDAFRGATWVSIHNGGGVGWGEAINGGFGMVLDGSEEMSKAAAAMLNWDVLNGIARRSWARNSQARWTASNAMNQDPQLKITLPHLMADDLFNEL
jgi:urocanate hydratase